MWGIRRICYGYAVVFGYCGNSYKYRSLGCPWTFYKVVDIKVEEVKVSL